jgi:hypothetical protein
LTISIKSLRIFDTLFNREDVKREQIMNPGSHTEAILVQQTTTECLNRQGSDAPKMRHQKVLNPIEFKEEIQWASGKMIFAGAVTVQA